MDALRRPDAAADAELVALGALGRLMPFAALDGPRLSALARAADLRHLPPRKTLLLEGSRTDALHVVLDGCVERYARSNGREVTTGILRAGDAFPLSALARDLPCLTSARTCAPSRVLRLPAADVRAAIGEDTRFARAVLGELAERHRAELRAHKEIKLRSATERLAARLLRYECEQGGRGSLVLPCDKRTLASLLAMTPENLSRAFATLGAVGVGVRGPTITLGDRAALADLARPDPSLDGPPIARRRVPDG